ncbi:MAG: hypothetical protein CTY25_04435 [Methylobacterium sp.]|nr:MAG: hypothetical protein CTY25_04435 [Methylobacterium sp.]
MSRDKTSADGAELRPDEGSLFGLILAPTTWALHFLAVYGLAAVACARGTKLQPAIPIWIGGLTCVALLAIILVSLPAWREFQRERNRRTDKADPEGRAHFLAHAALLLAGLSLFATALQALPALFAVSCR